MPEPKFRLFARPNASGKTHVFQKFRDAGYIHTEIYVNADKIQEELSRKRKFSFNAYRVKANDAEFKQYKLFATGQSFAFETVMSHKSKVEMLKMASKSGYKTYFYFIFTDSPTTNLARVRLRVNAGGHNVSDQIILDRIPRTFALLPAAFRLADCSYIIDNSIDARLIIKKENGELTLLPPYPKNISKQINKIIDRRKN